MPQQFVPDDFIVPTELRTDEFLLVPLRLEHNEGDLAAWSSSSDHIHATPGFEGHPWPNDPMTLERNAEDVAGHVKDWGEREGFTYSVLSATSGAVIGCVYIYPPRRESFDAAVRSWVTASVAHLDQPLFASVTAWLKADWPFTRPEYAARP
jgi:hypothetical protein